MTTATADFLVKAGDSLPIPEGTLRGGDGNPINGSGATVRFHMRPLGASSWTIDAPAVWTDQAGGVAHYSWQPGDTDDAGTYEFEFQVTFSDATILSFPNEGYKLLEVFADELVAFWPTPDDFARRLNVKFDQEQLESAQALLDDIVDLVKSESRQHIEPVTGDVVHLVGNWGRTLNLPERPVGNVSSVTFATAAGPLPLSSALYWWTRQGELFRGSPLARNPFEGLDDVHTEGAYLHWGGPAAEIIVTYDHGFAGLPGGLRAVILSAARRAWANADGVEAESLGNYSVTYARTTDPRTLFSDEQLRTIRDYRQKVYS